MPSADILAGYIVWWYWAAVPSAAKNKSPNFTIPGRGPYDQWITGFVNLSLSTEKNINNRQICIWDLWREQLSSNPVLFRFYKTRFLVLIPLLVTRCVITCLSQWHQSYLSEARDTEPWVIKYPGQLHTVTGEWIIITICYVIYTYPQSARHVGPSLDQRGADRIHVGPTWGQRSLQSAPILHLLPIPWLFMNDLKLYQIETQHQVKVEVIDAYFT